MRILIVSQYFWPENFRITDLANALKQSGHEVSVLTGLPNYPTGKIFKGYSWIKKYRETMDGIPIFRVPLFARRSSRGWQLALNYMSFVFFACLLGPWLLRKQKFDIVFTFGVSPVTVGIPAILMSKLKKAPLFYWIQDLWPESLSATGVVNSPAILSAVRYVVKKIYKHCDRLLVQSPDFIQSTIKVGVKQEKIIYLPNWAESLYQPIEVGSVKRPSQLPPEGFMVMFAGNVGVAQSLETIIEAASILQKENINWVFLGEGRQFEWLKKVVNNKQLHKVYILGRQPLESMPIYFSFADSMLVTLREEPIVSKTIPSKLQSYLACGKPILGALNGAGSTVINESRAGFCVAPGDSSALAQAVLKMSKLPKSELKLMEEKSLAYYKKHFDRDKLVNQLECWMYDAVNKRC